MITVEDLQNWLTLLDPKSGIGVDEGGLTLREVKDGKLTEAYYEIGGIPEEIENV